VHYRICNLSGALKGRYIIARGFTLGKKGSTNKKE
jgi:hypothetical protein